MAMRAGPVSPSQPLHPLLSPRIDVWAHEAEEDGSLAAGPRPLMSYRKHVSPDTELRAAAW